MKKATVNSRTGLSPSLQRILGCLLLFVLWAIPSSMKATYVDQTYNYSVYYTPPENLQLKLALYDCDGADCWVKDGYVYVEIVGESNSKKTLLHYKAETDIDNDHKYNRAKFETGVDGTVQIVRGIDHGDEIVGKSQKTISIYRPNTSQEYFSVDVKWFIPLEYRGKKIRISFKVQRNGNARSDQAVDGIATQEFQISELEALVIPELMTPMLAYETANAGNIMVPWMIATTKVKKVTMRYQDEAQKQHEQSLDTVSSGFVYVPFEEIRRQCYVEVQYEDNEKKIRTSKSAAIDIPILHTAKNFKATLQTDGTALLTWSIDRPGYKDIMYSDLWEIQRCIGDDNNESKWQNIGQVSYDNDTTAYSFLDDRLFTDYQTDSIYYRVRRASTALWGWNYSVGTSKALLKEQFFLPYFDNATVTKDSDWGINDKHNVTIKWDVRSTPLSSYDLDGNFVIRSREDWKKFAALVNDEGKTNLNAVMLADVNLGSEQTMVGTSDHPYKGLFNGNGHKLTFKYTFNINENQSDKNVENHPIAPFAFVDDGVTIKGLQTAGSITTNAKFAAGIIGMIVKKNYSQTVEISSCRSSVTINTTVKGDGTNAGLIAVSRNDQFETSINIFNCLFDGELIGKETTSWGVLIGWFYIGTARIEHCFLNPKTLDFDKNNSSTLARTTRGSIKIFDNYSNVILENPYGVFPSTDDANRMAKNLGDGWTVVNDECVPLVVSFEESTYTMSGSFILRNAKDWKKFCELVNGGQTKLNAVMADNVNLGDVQSKVGICNIWRDEAVYQGDFNGNGYTLTVNYVDTDNKSTACAPFAEIGGDCRIHDLHVKGSISSAAERTASLVANIKNGNVRLEKIVSDVSVSCHSSIQAYDNVFGGFIGEVRNDIQLVSIKDCAFYGSMQCDGDGVPDIGGMIGWQNGYCTVSLSNVLFAPQLIQSNIPHQSPHAFITGHSGAVCTLSNCLSTYTGWPLQEGATDASQMTASAIAGKMGSAWTVEEGRAVPANAVKNSGEDATGDIAIWDDRAKVSLHANMYSASGEMVHTFQRDLTQEEISNGQLSQQLVNTCVDYEFYLTIERDKSPLYIGLKSRDDSYDVSVMKTELGDASNYEFNLNGEVTGVNSTRLQSSVQLDWKTNNMLVDFYRVLRRDKADTTGKVDTLVTNYTQTRYVDVTPQPQHVYIYRVEAIVDCEGQHLSYAECEGNCAPTGMVQGYVRLADGTAVAGATVVAEADPASKIVGAVKRSTVTDESGFFQIDSLVYQNIGTYIITVTRKGNEGQLTPQNVDFTTKSNLASDLIFYVNDYFTYSGFVMYEGSSIPVLGAQFKLDGQIITKSSGKDKGKPVTTNSAGEFSLSIPKGTHKVQVVKDGHVFADKGFLINKKAPEGVDNTDYDFQDNIYDKVIWDKTRVTLRGRVVGGVDQGNKPLGRSISVNNLGDSIRIVLELEGDNTSYIVRDPLDETIRTRDSLYFHGVSDTTRMVANRHRIIISPDNKTGEYEVPFYPVKYKVTDIYCNGYATLFQAGKVGETLDLSENVLGDTIVYNRIYHNPATLAYEQFTGTIEGYYGLKEYVAQDNLGKNVTVQLWKDGKYSFGHPVFMAGSPTLLTLSAREEYYYNNVKKDQPDDIVLLSGGTVYMHNGLISAEHSDSVQLNEEGKASYLFTPENLTFTQEGDNALKSLTFTLLYDNTYYDIKPLQGYVMASQAKPQGRRMVASGLPHLIDILRDPPGGESSAYIESGSKLKYGYHYDLKIEAGFNVTLKQGQGADYYTGLWAGEGGGTEGGNINSSSSNQLLNFGFTIGYNGGWNYSYEFEATQKIETASGIKSVGAVADLYIGMTDETVLEDAIAVRAIPESMYKLLVPATGNTFEHGGRQFEVKLGTVKVLAEGLDADGNKVYLIRDEVLRAYPRVHSTFAHSEGYIENELLPQLLRIRESMMLPVGTTDKEAQAQADRLKHPMYVSKVPTSDPRYAQTNEKGEYNYIQYIPTGSAVEWPDTIAALNSQIVTWIGFLAVNEMEKLNVSESDKVKTFSFDGNAKVEYDESFTYGVEKERYMKLPIVSTPMTILGDDFFGALTKTLDQKKGGDNKAKENIWTNEIEFSVAGQKLELEFKPIITFEFNQNNTMAEEHSKKTGFTLSCDRQSYIMVDVYRSSVDLTDYEEKIKNGDLDVIYKYSEETKNEILQGLPTYMPRDAKVYGNFIFRTRGGATKKPYEDERLTEYYNVGQVLDAKTIPIDNLKIWTEQATVSNVPYGEPAKFLIHLANESEVPSFATHVLQLRRIDNDENSKGAKIFVDGQALTPNGISVLVEPNTVVDKVVEVYAGSEFDYENLTMCFWDPDDTDRAWNQNISAHFIPSAGNVTITSPDNRWVINTESPYNKDKQQYYMPVRIENFNVNARGFDHIELQYKLTTEGDKSWVNVCSYFKSDSLMQLATGERKLIKNDGYIDDAIFYGEKDPVEQYYDIRAVVYCRHAGGFITSSSPVLSGVKDTRIPKPFGTPKPVDGILEIGDDIIVSFSEPIAGNYLSKLNNFEVLGTPNSSNIALSTALRFNGGSTAFTQSNRYLAGKSFSFDMMINPDNNGKPMAVLSHGDLNHYLSLGVTEDRHLFAIMDGEMAISNTVVDFKGLHQVVYTFEVLDENNMMVTFYDGSLEIGSQKLSQLYQGQGTLYLGLSFGQDSINSIPVSLYEGSMLELRLWNTAVSSDFIGKYSQKVLTGYELNLIDNYALNEGDGIYSYDKAPGGNDLELVGTSWIVPAGISLKLDGDKGTKLKGEYFTRRSYDDYTLMFWFRTYDDFGTLMSNGLAQDEANNGNHFYVGVDDGNLVFRASGQEVKSSVDVSDGAWHHFAVTVNRSRNVGNLYVDKKLVETFPVEDIGGISGNKVLAVGATYTDEDTAVQPLTGHIDEIAMYEMVLPENLIVEYASSTPSGKEMGTMVYLPFSTIRRDTDNLTDMKPTGISLRRYKDNQGNISETRIDTIISQDVIAAQCDYTTYARMRDKGNLVNLAYSYVVDNQDLLINLDVPEANIEKTNVYITVKDVADLNGNLTASPVTMDLYVYRNPLRWAIKRMNISAAYGEGLTFEATVQNLSGKKQTYTLSGLPIWLTASKTAGSIAALDEESITFTVSPYINIGDFNEKLYLQGENGMTEPLPVSISVRGDEPEWKVSEDLKARNITMHMVARVTIDGQVSRDANDILAVFGDDHQLLGVTYLDVDQTANANEALAYLTIYNNADTPTPLHFEFFDATTGQIHVVEPQNADVDTITFKANLILGSSASPITLKNFYSYVQTLHLKKGWNWLSFAVTPQQQTVNELLNNSTKWEVGDGLEVITSKGEAYQYAYKSKPDPKDPNGRIYFWDHGSDSIEVNPSLMYRLYSKSAKTGYISGWISYHPIHVKNGWNRIGYNTFVNLPLSIALSDYTDLASEGDMIKSQNEFAVLNVIGEDNKVWKGSLKYLRSGEGYMIKRNASDEVSFFYPRYGTNSRYTGGSVSTANAPMRRSLFDNSMASNMSVIAVTAGVELEEGDRLVAYHGAEVCGIAEADEDGIFYLTVAESDNSAAEEVQFSIERDGEVVALTTQTMRYVSDAVVGEVNEPTVINFMPTDGFASGEWYTVQGIRLAEKPTRKGVYIFNGQKVFVK